MRIKSYYLPTVIGLTVTSIFAGMPEQKPRQGLPTIDQKIVTNLGTGCRIGIYIPDVAKRHWLISDSDSPTKSNGGSIYIRYGDIPRPFKGKQCDDCAFTIGVDCVSSNDAVVTSGWAKRGNAHAWQINFAPDDSTAFRQKVRIHQLSTRNAQGWAVTFDDEIGDELNRQRHLHYCLIREPKAICGQGVMGTLEVIKRRPKTDLTPYALQILRTIEFVDDVPSSDGAASSP